MHACMAYKLILDLPYFQVTKVIEGSVILFAPIPERGRYSIEDVCIYYNACLPPTVSMPTPGKRMKPENMLANRAVPDDAIRVIQLTDIHLEAAYATVG